MSHIMDFTNAKESRKNRKAILLDKRERKKSKNCDRYIQQLCSLAVQVVRPTSDIGNKPKLTNALHGNGNFNLVSNTFTNGLSPTCRFPLTHVSNSKLQDICFYISYSFYTKKINKYTSYSISPIS